MNESPVYLLQLIDYIGNKLRTTAVVERLRQMRFAFVTTQHALLARSASFSLPALLNNVRSSTKFYLEKEAKWGSQMDDSPYTPELEPFNSEID